MRLLLNCVTTSLHLRFSGSVLRTDLPDQQLRLHCTLFFSLFVLKACVTFCRIAKIVCDFLVSHDKFLKHVCAHWKTKIIFGSSLQQNLNALITCHHGMESCGELRVMAF